MISSRKLNFDFSKRRALFVSALKAAVYHWDKGELGSSYLFDANDEGREYFRRYLRETPNIPVYLITDVFEEEFKLDTAPHVFGGDRAAIFERKKARLFRDTPYYCTRVLGREEEGRKDDRVLFSAITNPKLVSTWVKLLEEHKVPLAGVYSVPLLTQSLLKLLPDSTGNCLVVSIQSISGLRQTFIHNNHLRLSRLVQLPRYGTEPYAPLIRDEVEKIRRYLNSLRLTSVEEPLDRSLNIYFLSTGDLLEELKAEYGGVAPSRMYFLDTNDLLEKSGSSCRAVSPFCDQLLVRELLRQKPANYYARASERRYYTMRNMRISMLAASILILVASIAWSGYTFMEGLGYRQNTLLAQKKASFYTDRYQIAREGLPKTPVEAEDLKTGVELAEELSRYKADPLQMVRLISSAMNRFPAIKLHDFQWLSSIDPNLGTEAGRSTVNQTASAYGNTAGIADNSRTEYDYYQIAEIDAEVKPFDGNYRIAIALINEFSETLRSRENVYDVSILSLPLDISSEASLQGSASSVRQEARFSLRVVLGVSHEV